MSPDSPLASQLITKGPQAMGVRRLFTGEGKIFQGGGQKTYYLPKKCL